MLRCDATTCVRPMPSCSILWVLKAHMEEDMPAGIAITNTDHTTRSMTLEPWRASAMIHDCPDACVPSRTFWRANSAAT